MKRYKKNHWIKCECCGGWWHIENACVSKDSDEKFDLYKTDYTCVLCVFDVLPRVTVSCKKRCETVTSVEYQPAEEKQLPRFIDDSLEPEVHETVVTPTQTLFKSTPTKLLPDLKSPEPQSESPCNKSHVDSSPEQVIVVDNIEQPKELRNSEQTEGKLKNFE